MNTFQKLLSLFIGSALGGYATLCFYLGEIFFEFRIGFFLFYSITVIVSLFLVGLMQVLEKLSESLYFIFFTASAISVTCSISIHHILFEETFNEIYQHHLSNVLSSMFIGFGYFIVSIRQKQEKKLNSQTNH